MKKSKSKGGGLRAYARHRKELGLLGSTLSAVQKARDRGQIKLVDGEIPDFARADKQWERNADPDEKVRRTSAAAGRKPPRKSRPGAAPSGDPLFNQYRETKNKHESLKATKLELEVARLQGSLIPAEEVTAAQEARAAQEREALLNLPSRISGDLAAALGVPERKLYAHLDRAIRAHLAERSSRLLSNAA